MKSSLWHPMRSVGIAKAISMGSAVALALTNHPCTVEDARLVKLQKRAIDSGGVAKVARV